MSTISKDTDEKRPAAKPRAWQFPSAFTVLAGVTLVVWALAFVIPTGSYDISEKTGGPAPGTYHGVETGLSFVDRLMQLFLAPINGLYGVQSSDTGFIGPYETGELFGAAGVFLFVIAIGIFITLAMKTGAIDNGVARVANRFSGRGAALIVILMVLFSIGGTTEGMAEETLGFYALVIPLMLSLGYDRMVAAATILVGAGVGVLASTVNPFATGVASDAAGISIGDGIGYRLLMYVVLVPVAVWFVLRYAKKVKNDPSRSLTSAAGRRRGDRQQRCRRGPRDHGPAEGRPRGGRVHLRVHDLRDRAVGAGDQRPDRRELRMAAGLVLPRAGRPLHRDVDRRRSDRWARREGADRHARRAAPATSSASG